MQALFSFLSRRAPLIAFLGALLVFAPTLGHGFLAWDDRVHTLDNPRLYDTGYFWAHPDQGLYMPITFSLWSLVARAVGESSIAFHALNLILHAGSALLCFDVLRQLFKLDPFRKELDDERVRIASLLGALLFAWHPLQVEPVSWITSLKDVSSGFFSLAALAAYLRPSATPEQTARLRALSILLLGLASLCKPAAIGALFLIFSIEILFRQKSFKQAARACVPFALVMLPSLIVNMSSQSRLTLLFHTPLLYRPLVALDALGFYARKVIAPWELLPAYERAPRALIESDRILYTWFLPAVLLYAVFKLRRALPHLFQSVVLFGCGVILVLGLKPFAAQDNSTVYDHYLYLAMLGPAWALAYFSTRSRRATRFALILLLLFAGKSLVQSRAWKNDEALWTFTMNRQDSVVALANLASIKSARGEVDVARAMLEHAIETKPYDPLTHNNLGALLAKQGRLDLAGPHFAQAVQLDPNDVAALDNFARYQLQKHDVGGSERTLRRLLALSPEHRDGNLTLGEIFVNTGRPEQALALLRPMLPKIARDPEALTLLGVAEAQTQQVDAAVFHFQRALSVDPDYAMARTNLETALKVRKKGSAP